MGAGATCGSTPCSRRRSFPPIRAWAAPRSATAWRIAPTPSPPAASGNIRKALSRARCRKCSRRAVRVGDWLFIAGQDAVDVANRTLFVGDLRGQTEQCIRQLQWIVEGGRRHHGRHRQDDELSHRRRRPRRSSSTPTPSNSGGGSRARGCLPASPWTSTPCAPTAWWRSTRWPISGRAERREPISTRDHSRRSARLSRSTIVAGGSPARAPPPAASRHWRRGRRSPAAPPARWRRAARCRPARGVRTVRPAMKSASVIVGLLRRDRQAVDLRKLAERVVAGHEEIAEQQRIRPRRRRHVDKEAVERLRPLRRRQQIDVVALRAAAPPRRD